MNINKDDLGGVPLSCIGALIVLPTNTDVVCCSLNIHMGMNATINKKILYMLVFFTFCHSKPWP